MLDRDLWRQGSRSQFGGPVHDAGRYRHPRSRTSDTPGASRRSDWDATLGLQGQKAHGNLDAIAGLLKLGPAFG